MTSNTPVSSGTVVSSAGTSRIDDILVTGTAIAVGTAPTVTTGTGAATSSTAATVTGSNVTAAGTSTVSDRGVYFSTTAGVVALAGGAQQTAGSSGTGLYNTSLTGLTANTTYYVAAYATNSTATSRGGQTSFVTQAAVTTTTATSVTYTTATANGSVAAGGGASTISDRGVYYSTTAGVVATGGGTKQVATTATGTGTLAAALTGLTPGTTYYYAAYATTTGGTSYGTELSFVTTALTTPTVATATPTGFTSTSATLGGSVTNTGGSAITEYGVVYSTTNNPPTTADTKVQITTGTASSYSQVVALAAGTYFVRAYAINGVGTGYDATVKTLIVNPSPVIASFSPSPINAGNGPTNLVVTSSGNSFGVTGSGTTATVNGVLHTVSGVTPGSLTIALLATDVATAGTLTIVITTPTTSYPGGGTSPSATVQVVNATPTISSLSPNTAGASSTIATFTVTGTGFSAASVITFNGTALTTTFPTGNAGTQLTASNVAVPATPGTYNVTVTNPAPGGISNVATFTVTPVLAAAPVSLAFTTAAGAASAAQTYALSGAGLPTGGSIRVSLPASTGFEVSTDGTNFSQSASISYTGTALPTSPAPLVYVRLTAGLAVGSYSTTITNTAYDNGNNATATTATVAVTGAVAKVYTWIGAANASWSTATNWSPSRTTPTINDILQFNTGSSTNSPVFTADETIGHLTISNNTTINISSTRLLTISDLVAGTDLSVAAGATLTLYNTNTSTSVGLEIDLAPGATATIAGTLILDAASSASGSHTLIGSGSVNSIEFVSGSICRATAGFVNNAFGTSAAAAKLNNVIFRNGSRYEQYGGANPFGVAASTGSETVFEPTSYYYYNVTTAPSFSGRTYGIFEYATTATISGSGASALTFGGDLIVSAGTLNLNLTTSATVGGVNLQGNILMNGGTLAFGSTNPTQTVQFNGTALQTIGGTATSGIPTFGTATTVQINNAVGVTLARAISVPGVLQLTNGKLNTDATNTITLPAAAIVTGGSNASFVNGPVVRTIGTVTSLTSYTFPVGRNAAYRPIVLNVNSQTPALGNTLTYYRAVQTEGAPAVSGFDASSNLKRVSNIRFFTLSPFASNPGPLSAITQNANFSGTVTLSFGSDDGVNKASDATLVVAKRADATSAWFNFGHTADSGGGVAGGVNVSGTITSSTISTFSDFVLGATNVNTLTSTEINPLPVSLTSFTAVRASSGVALAWATASEQNSASFVVERSSDGVDFVQVTSVPAAGSSIASLAYTAFDRSAPATALYYRLRSVDTDGSSTFSAVVAVAGSAAEATLTLVPNPAHESLRLTTETASDYVVRSTLGQVVLKGTAGTGTTTIGVAGLPSGVYFFELQTGSGRVVRKFVKN